MADLTNLADRLALRAIKLRRNASAGFNGDESRGAAKALEEIVEELRTCEKEEVMICKMSGCERDVFRHGVCMDHLNWLEGR